MSMYIETLGGIVIAPLIDNGKLSVGALSELDEEHR